MGQVVEERGCNNPKCGSSDALKVYLQEDSSVNATCFSCKGFDIDPYNKLEIPAAIILPTGERVHKTASPSDTPITRSIPTPSSSRLREPQDNQSVLDDCLTYPIRAIPDRKISRDTCEHYGVRVALSPTDGCTITSHFYPRTRKGKLTAFKERIVETKRFFSKGDSKDVELFGQDVCKAGGKKLWITEGECDAMALYQTLVTHSTLDGWQPAVVSLSNGSASAAKDITLSFDFVDSFEEIILVFDQDEPGEAAVADVCQLLAGKVSIAKLAEKDANDMVLKNKESELYWDVMKHARAYMPDNIINYGECWDRYKTGKNKECYPYPEAYTDLNAKTYGVRSGSLVTITSGSGMGKTQFMRELKDHYHRTTDFKFADIALEEDAGDTMAGMMSIYLNKRIELPDVQVSDEEEQEAFDFYYSGGRWFGYDHFGGMDDSNLFSKIRYFAAKGCKFIYLDHLSIIVSEYAAQGGERERIDTIMTKLAKLVKELDIVIFLIVHLKKTTGGFNAPSFE
ncbi:MAG: bifunctional DNA primase/helicase, partial [Candidatus Thorarchaeota archaeon]